MLSIAFVSFFIGVFFLVVAITFAFMRLQQQQGQAVLPESRSSHSIPTFNGGAIGVVLVSLGMVIYLFWPLGITPVLFALLPLALAAGTGYLDDHHGLSGRVKLGLTAIAILPLLFEFSAGLLVMFFSMTVVPAFVVLPVACFGMLWIVHLTNFMDGIDGLATVQVIFMLLSVWLFRDLLLLSEANTQLLLGVVVACLAFLPFNFPKAKIFLGDTGSLFFGVLMAWLLVTLLKSHANGLWVFLILFSMFWVDTTVTLFRRLRRRKSVFEAHREHAYQHLANECWHSHVKTTLFIAAVNVAWLLPMAYGALRSNMPLLWFVVAVLPIVAYAIRLGAGEAVRNDYPV